MQQDSQNFREESDALAEILRPLKDEDFDRVTLFKDWTIADVVGHLHLWNIAADLTLNQPEQFIALLTDAGKRMGTGGTHQELTRGWLRENGGLSGQGLVEEWVRVYRDVADKFGQADPNHRVKWGGPDMSTRSCIIARQMETWAHAQAVFDVLGIERQAADRLKSVAHIGVTTYRWSFQVNGLEAPMPKPYVRLTAPSGAIWEWNDEQADNCVRGDAMEFCQVVTQCRGLADTSLEMVGENATKWMSIAQAFAGGPEKQPAKGQRRIARTAG